MKIHNACSVELIDSMGDDLRVANAARVSFDKWRDEFTKKDERLIAYLANHDHWTPFSQVVISIRFGAPIFTARQWFKGQVGVTRNEVSRRYVDTPPEFYIPDTFHARPSDGIKQGSGEKLNDNMQTWMTRTAHHYADQALERYNNMITDGIAPEEARIFLPQNTMTSWVETGSLAYYARTCRLRLDGHAQKAIQELAGQVSDIVADVAPVSWKFLMGEQA